VRVREVFGRGWPVFSFEFFPPKTDEGAHTLMNTVADLNEVWKPDFVSVTYGAGGGTRERTLDVVTSIQSRLGIRTMAHLTCVGATREETAAVAQRLADSGIRNILALRGDAPKDAPPTRQEFGGACYPETHIESRSADLDLAYTRLKVDKGASFLITQLFFDNQLYFDFVARARAAGITVPILPGIMPITNVAQVERFTQLCGASIPKELSSRLSRVREDPALVMATGIEHAIRQCRNLLERGAPGLHFYTLNKSYATRCILAAVRRD
jgi:methylenetetrahydrofolate reductase (NADPH)